MKYVFDIDGTICSQEKDYTLAKPYGSRIERINRLYEEGNLIWLYTARGTDTGIDWSKITKEQLKRWGVKYDILLFGKPSADRYIDDKGINANSNEW